MINQLKSMGIGTGIGLLAGIPLMIWIAPTTSSGAIVILVLCALIGFIAGEVVAVIARLSGARREKE